MFSFQLLITIEMKDYDGSSSKEIDTFAITVPFPTGIQEQEYIGDRGIANITLSSYFLCIVPDACNSAAVSLQSTGIRSNIHLYGANAVQFIIISHNPMKKLQ